MSIDIVPNNHNKNLFLPDFCNVYRVFLVIIVTELFAFIVVLVPLSKIGYQWDYIKEFLLFDLAMVSLFMQWVTIVSLGVLCWVRSSLSNLDDNRLVGLLAYLLILTVTSLVSEWAWLLNQYSLSVELTFSINHMVFLLKGLVLGILGSALVGGLLHQYMKKSVLIFGSMGCGLIIIGGCEWFSIIWSLPALQEEAYEHLLFLLRNLGISAILSAIVLRYLYMQYQWRKETEASAYAHLQALQARIRPHFLFNSMNTIASLIRFSPDKAEQIVEDFADLFRAILSHPKTLVPWRDEVTLCQQYLGIEKLRLGERLQILWKVENVPDDALIPSLCLQPLLENAIYHSIQSLPEGGTLEFTAQFDGKVIHITLKNPKDLESLYQGHQIAQQNTQQRLQAYYGSQASLSIQDLHDVYQVTLYFPYRTQDHENYYC